jgi:cytochrome c oxidase subunit IV
MTVTALAIGYVPMPEGVKAILLVGVTLAKIALIGRIFMHLKFEKMNLVMLTFSPLVISVILFFMTRLETRMQDPTHVVVSHEGEKIPAGHAEGAEGRP